MLVYIYNIDNTIRLWIATVVKYFDSFDTIQTRHSERTIERILHLHITMLSRGRLLSISISITISITTSTWGL